MILPFLLLSPIGTIKLRGKWRNWSRNKVIGPNKWTQILFFSILGVNSFKFYLAYENVLMVTDRQFYEVGQREKINSKKEIIKGLKQCARLKALARVHAENGPVIAAREKELLEFGVTGPEGKWVV